MQNEHSVGSNPRERNTRVIGLDQGEKIIGVAVSDATWLIARPVGLIQRTTKAADFARINDYIAEFEAGLIVVGLPENPDPDEDNNEADDSREKNVHRWASRLAAAVEIPVVLWNESYSTEEADRLLADAGARPRDYTARIDDVAAAVILQSFLDEMRDVGKSGGNRLPPPVKYRAGYDSLLPSSVESTE